MTRSMIHRRALPRAVYQDAHCMMRALGFRGAPNTAVTAALYSAPNSPNLQQTAESVWRGLVRTCLQHYVLVKGGTV